MKKQVLFLCFLVTGICSCLITNTAALYTTSNVFEGNLQIDYFAHDYLKYEFSHNLTCSYWIDGTDQCTQGSVAYENSTGIISISGDAGALRKYEKNNQLASYDVNVHLIQNSPAELKNFGIYFNGSRAVHQNTGVNAIGYVLKFTNAGDLVITKEGYGNQISMDHHENDSLLHVDTFEHTWKVEKASIDALQLDPDNLNIKISVVCNGDGHLDVTVYFNGTQIGDTFTIQSNLNEYYIDGSGSGRVIGVSSYGDHSVIVDSLYIDQEKNKGM